MIRQVITPVAGECISIYIEICAPVIDSITSYLELHRIDDATEETDVLLDAVYTYIGRKTYCYALAFLEVQVTDFTSDWEVSIFEDNLRLGKILAYVTEHTFEPV